MIVAGIGFRRNCPPDVIVEIVRTALSQAGLSPDALGLLAVPAFKSSESGPAGAARVLNVDTTTVGDAALGAAQANCVTRSEVALRETGFHSVAEGTALAAAGPGGRLILPRIDNGSATCALAEGAAQ